MSDIGYLYVLANSAMPGLVKIGKTTRTPAERAIELSGATGLPTPFIVVYEQMFQDCSAAESFVHTYLANQGFRVSDNREFFNAPVNDVVRAIILVPDAITASTTTGHDDEDEGLLSEPKGDELDSLTLESASSTPVPVWASIFSRANDVRYGMGDHIQDFGEALSLYKQAIKLGCIHAYSQIAEMYQKGVGVREDKAKALEYLKEGARRGSGYCYWAMGMMFYDENNQSNAEKAFALFLKNAPPPNPDGDSHDVVEWSFIIMGAFKVVDNQVHLKKPIPPILGDFIKTHLKVIKDKTESFMEISRRRENLDNLASYAVTMAHLESLQE